MSRPSDSELMMYFDGELEPARREAVAKYLLSSREAAKKVRGLRRRRRDARPPRVAIDRRGRRGRCGDGDDRRRSAGEDRPSDLSRCSTSTASSSPSAARSSRLTLQRRAMRRRRSAASPSAVSSRAPRHSLQRRQRTVADAVMAVIAEEAAKQDDIGIPPEVKVARPSTARPSTCSCSLPATTTPSESTRPPRSRSRAAAALPVWVAAAPTRMPTAAPTPSAEVAPSVVAAAPAPAPSAAVSADEDTEPEKSCMVSRSPPSNSEAGWAASSMCLRATPAAPTARRPSSGSPTKRGRVIRRRFFLVRRGAHRDPRAPGDAPRRADRDRGAAPALSAAAAAARAAAASRHCGALAPSRDEQQHRHRSEARAHPGAEQAAVLGVQQLRPLEARGARALPEPSGEHPPPEQGRARRHLSGRDPARRPEEVHRRPQHPAARERDPAAAPGQRERRRDDVRRRAPAIAAASSSSASRSFLRSRRSDEPRTARARSPSGRGSRSR